MRSEKKRPGRYPLPDFPLSALYELTTGRCYAGLFVCLESGEAQSTLPLGVTTPQFLAWGIESPITGMTAPVGLAGFLPRAYATGFFVPELLHKHLSAALAGRDARPRHKDKRHPEVASHASLSAPKGSHSRWDQVSLAALPFALAQESLLSASVAPVASQ